MNKVLWPFAVLVVLGAAALQACDQTPQKTVHAQWDTANISVVWVPTSEIDAKCQALGVKDARVAGACAAVTRNHCTIYTPQPRNFNDRPNMYLLGHEAWHCFGAFHN